VGTPAYTTRATAIVITMAIALRMTVLPAFARQRRVPAIAKKKQVPVATG